MNSDMEWSVETYRLDEIVGKFDLPCVIRVNEGFYSATDAEVFSQGDILSIDSKMVLQKVAASFTEYSELNTPDNVDKEYTELKNEILVPLNYQGKLKVIRSSKNYESVRELANDFPRYATLRQDLHVTTEENKLVTLKSETIIELDRNISESPSGLNKQPNKISIQFQHSGRRLNVELPVNASGKFRTELDNNEYTIKEALDRYNLPLHVRFVDDKIKRVYTQDLLEGIENMNIITETLRLNRLVKQTVLVGHYKPVNVHASKDTDRFRQRTLAVLPMDNPHICGTEVNVSKAVTDDIYEQAFLVRNVSHNNTEDTVDGSLYVDFAMTSAIKLISEKDDENHGDIPPPRPPKRSSLAPPKIGPKPKTKWKGKQKALSLDSKEFDVVKGNKSDSEDDEGDYIVPEARTGPKPKTKWKGKQKALSLDSKDFGVIKGNKSDDEDDEGDYIVPKARSVSETDDYSGFTLANMDFTPSDTAKGISLRRKICKKVVDNITNIKSSFRGLTISKFRRESNVFEAELEKCRQSFKDDPFEEQGLYDELNEKAMLEFTNPQSPTSSKPGSKRTNDSYLRAIKYREKVNKPMALVQPVKGSPKGKAKPFKDLNNQELIERLRLCGLTEMSEFCKTEMLDGSFFSHLSAETLENDMNLKGIQLAKFIQMRDANWVPYQKF